MKRYQNSVVLFVSDFHAPYHHPKTLDFLSKINDQFKPDRIIHGGDHSDIYSISNYPTSVEHPDTWHQEVKGLRKFTKDLAEIFPELIICDSNHDARPYRKATASGIPREMILPYSKIIEAPDTWKWVPYYDLTVDADRSNWRFIHTMNGGSAINAAKYLGMSVCMGHWHSRSGCQAFNNGKKTIWGCDSGCFISDKGSPFKYNRTDIGRPIRSCVIIIEGKPQMVMFD